jgi:hypothetical protein
VRRRINQASVVLVVVGLHLAGAMLWWTAERGMQWDRGEDKRLSTVGVWLAALTAESAKSKATPNATFKRNNTPVEQRKVPNAAPRGASTDISSSIPVTLEPSGSPTDQGETQTLPALNLNLSRKTITSVAPPSFAEQSPFHGRLPATVERQIASAAAETGPWAEERLDDDHIRFRRGTTCINMQRPREAIIDPMNEAAARLPWRANVESC